jgi:hypothetical protein
MAYPYPITGPIAPYNNVPIQPQWFQPSQFFISNITLGVNTTITTTTDMNYVIGQQVRLIIPFFFGCRQLNEKTGVVISIPASNQVITNIDSAQNVDAFTASASTTQPQIMAIGDVNTGVINSNGILSTGTFIPGSFQNISPT